MYVSVKWYFYSHTHVRVLIRATRRERDISQDASGATWEFWVSDQREKKLIDEINWAKLNPKHARTYSNNDETVDYFKISQEKAWHFPDSSENGILSL